MASCGRGQRIRRQQYADDVKCYNEIYYSILRPESTQRVQTVPKIVAFYSWPSTGVATVITVIHITFPSSYFRMLPPEVYALPHQNFYMSLVLTPIWFALFSCVRTHHMEPIPHSVRSCESLTTFRKRLKDTLFSVRAFSAAPYDQRLRFNFLILALYKSTYLLTYLRNPFKRFLDPNRDTCRHQINPLFLAQATPLPPNNPDRQPDVILKSRSTPARGGSTVGQGGRGPQ